MDKKKAVRNPWDFSAPAYDKRDGRAVNAGWDHGSGYKNPVGTEKTSGIDSGPIPMNYKCFNPKDL